MFAHKADVIRMSRRVYIVTVKAKEELCPNGEVNQNEVYKVAESKRRISQKIIKLWSRFAGSENRNDSK
jgi:hypothetical protein